MKKVYCGDEENEALEALSSELPQSKEPLALDKNNVQQGLAKLVLTLIELIRRLMEKQAVRRMEAGSLTDQEIEDLGETFMKLEEKMEELKVLFDLTDQDLNLNLGPLGDLM